MPGIFEITNSGTVICGQPIIAGGAERFEAVWLGSQEHVRLDPRRRATQLYVGLDVSQISTHLCVVDGSGRQVWRGRCSTDPYVVVQSIGARAGPEAGVGIETAF